MQVQVLVDVPRTSENKFFTYYVPPSLAQQVTPGKRVLVQLGEVLHRGFVFYMEEGEDTDDLKPVLDVLDEVPLLDNNLLELAQWLSDYYMAPLNRVVRAMFPALLDDPEKELVVIDDPVNQGENDHTDSIDGQSWKNPTGPDGNADILDLLRSGKARIRPRSWGEAYPSGVEYCLSAMPTDDEVNRLKRRAPRQGLALHFFIRHGQPLTERQAVAEFGVSVLNRLVEKGYIERRPLSPRVFQDPLLNEEQAEAIERISAALGEEKSRVFLLFGVTGSGKTEVYLRTIEKVCQQGQQCLVLIPEIGLTQQVTDIFEQRLGPGISVMHSRLSETERALEWLRVKQGKAQVVVGARSAVFAPFKDLGLVIIDEEQEASFRQEETPRYHARDVAIKRAERNGAVVIMGSATPSLESFHRAVSGEYDLITLSQKIASSGQSNVEIVDVRNMLRRGIKGNLSPQLVTELQKCVEAGNQAIVFLNRRGFATTVLCPACGLVLTCQACEIALNYHRDIDKTVCHYCGIERTTPQKCPRCHESNLRMVGTGIQRVEKELREVLPQARILRMDTDSAGKTGIEKMIRKIRDRKVDIALGTQMIAKGFDFPGVALVGVVNADPLLGFPDFRAREKAFQILVQVAGRAGRGDTRGLTLIQTMEPDDPFFDLVKSEDYIEFYNQEIAFRMALGYPPFSHLIKLLFSGPVESRVQEETNFVRNLIEEMIGELGDQIEILGPAPSIRPRIKNRYRYQIILKSTQLDLMRTITRYIMERRLPNQMRLDVDVDPLVVM
ncbi:MAG: primosomal protein N' [Syntrophomonadaceae bacterium]|nr:primosomal protein N' [Syntrophomonadaceae bacterium]